MCTAERRTVQPRPSFPPTTTVVSLLTAFVLIGCAGAIRPAADGGGANVITQDMIEAGASPTTDVRELLERLRPQWLRSRGQVSLQDENAGYPVVYVDGIRFGSLDTLRGLQVRGISRIEYIGSADATTRYGTGHMGGV